MRGHRKCQKCIPRGDQPSIREAVVPRGDLQSIHFVRRLAKRLRKRAVHTSCRPGPLTAKYRILRSLRGLYGRFVSPPRFSSVYLRRHKAGPDRDIITIPIFVRGLGFLTGLSTSYPMFVCVLTPHRCNFSKYSRAAHLQLVSIISQL